MNTTTSFIDEKELAAFDDAIEVARIELQEARDEYGVDSPEDNAAFDLVVKAEDRRQRYAESCNSKVTA